MKNLIFALLCFTIFASCKSNNVLSLKTDTTLNQIFSKEEIADLATILDFFDNEICTIEKKKNLKDCYKSFFQRMSDNIDNNIADVGIPLEKQLQVHKQLKNTIQEDIWYNSQRKRNRMRLDENNRAIYYPDTFYVYTLFSEGRYAKFLKEFSNENEKANFYFQQLNTHHSITPKAFADVIENYRSYDISDDRVRLLVAIHYLTVNHQQKYTAISEKKLDRQLLSEN